jgi:hypothetical protein
MAISSETEWTIVVCGLIAHADGVLDGEECERLLAYVDEMDADAYSEWLGIIGDKRALETKLAVLEPPAPAHHRDLLEQAWSMAMVDGDRCEEEVEQLQEIALAIGVEPMQLEFWREAWGQTEHDFSDVVAASAAAVLAGSGPVFPEDRESFAEFIQRLPTTNDHREELKAAAAIGGDVVTVGLRLTGMPRKVRKRAMTTLGSLVVGASRGEEAHQRFIELGVGAGLTAMEVDRILQRAKSRS